MSNSKIVNKRTFKALMAFLNPIGPIGTNVDMWVDEIEYFPTSWNGEKILNFKIIEIFDDFIRSIITNLGKKLYDSTDKNGPLFFVDVEINPRVREISLTPKYYTYTEVKDNRNFDWKELIRYYPLSKFMEDMEVDKLTIDYSGFENNFDSRIYYSDKELNKFDVRYFSDDIRSMIGEVFEDNDWNEYDGGHGTMIIDNERNGWLKHYWTKKNMTKGETIILTEEDFD